MVLQLVNGEAVLPPFVRRETAPDLDIPPTPTGDLLAEVLQLRKRVARQASLIELQADRIDLLQALLAPPGHRGRARLRRTPWLVRVLRRVWGA